jgi:hypothetical protein
VFEVVVEGVAIAKTLNGASCQRAKLLAAVRKWPEVSGLNLPMKPAPYRAIEGQTAGVGPGDLTRR